MSELPDGWTIERVRGVAQGPAELALVDTVATVDHFTPSDDGTLARDGTLEIRPTCIVDFSGLYLVRCAEDSEWYMGEADDAGVIRCWGSYGDDLEHAIQSL